MVTQWISWGGVSVPIHITPAGTWFVENNYSVVMWNYIHPRMCIYFYCNPSSLRSCARALGRLKKPVAAVIGFCCALRVAQRAPGEPSSAFRDVRAVPGGPRRPGGMPALGRWHEGLIGGKVQLPPPWLLGWCTIRVKNIIRGCCPKTNRVNQTKPETNTNSTTTMNMVTP